jgi:hypothetical protein
MLDDVQHANHGGEAGPDDECNECDIGSHNGTNLISTAPGR